MQAYGQKACAACLGAEFISIIIHTRRRFSGLTPLLLSFFSFSYSSPSLLSFSPLLIWAVLLAFPSYSSRSLVRFSPSFPFLPFLLCLGSPSLSSPSLLCLPRPFSCWLFPRTLGRSLVLSYSRPFSRFLLGRSLVLSSLSRSSLVLSSSHFSSVSGPFIILPGWTVSSWWWATMLVRRGCSVATRTQPGAMNGECLTATRQNTAWTTRWLISSCGTPTSFVSIKHIAQTRWPEQTKCVLCSTRTLLSFSFAFLLPVQSRFRMFWTR